jgi:hypothetical protein
MERGSTSGSGKARLEAGAACEDREEREQIGIAWEKAIVIEVDVVARLRRAVASAEDCEEGDEVFVCGHHAVVIEVDAVAGWSHADLEVCAAPKRAANLRARELQADGGE